MLTLNAPSKKLVVRLDTDPTTPLTFIAEGITTTYVAGIPTITRGLNVPLKVSGILPVDLVLADADPDKEVEITRVFVLNPNNAVIKFWLIEQWGSEQYPFVGIQAAAGDQFYITNQNEQTLDACGNLKVKNETCTVDDASFFTDYSFTLAA